MLLTITVYPEQAEKLKNREMKEVWMKNDEGWMKSDEWWRMKDDDFKLWWVLLTNERTNKQAFVIVESLSRLKKSSKIKS